MKILGASILAALFSPCHALLACNRVIPTHQYPTTSSFTGLLLSSQLLTRSSAQGVVSLNSFHSVLDDGEADKKPSTTERSICVLDTFDGRFEALTRKLATELSIAIIKAEDPVEVSTTFRNGLVIVPYEYSGVVTYAIAIQQFLSANLSKGRSRSGRSSPSPFFVDFCPPLASRQGKRIGGQSGKDLLLKAVGPFKGGKGLKICDLTAGFGQDSIILAKGGASSVLMVERDPVVALLLQDALRRLSLLADTGDPTAIELNNKLSLEMGDGIEVARRLMGLPSKEVPEIFYLDPMFPPRAKSAAVKKDMQILHSLLDSQGSSDVYNDTEMALSEAKLLDAAFDAARLRVVVKRPINAELLGGLDHSRRPTYDIRGSSYRWDVYVKQ